MQRIMNSEQIKRHIFPHQCSQVVIIDLNSECGVLINVIKALKDTISLIVSISGPSRVPSFSMVTVGMIECSFQLKPIKDNYEELINFLNNINDNLCSDRKSESLEGNFLKSLYAIIKQFTENDLIQKSENFSQNRFEITIISQSLNIVLRECREFCRNTNIKSVQKIHIVVPKCNYIDVLCSNDSNSNDFGEISVDEGVIEISQLRNNHNIIFEDIFKNWLLDNSLDSHHLDLILRITEDFVLHLKCDLQECIVQPSTLPQASSLSLETDYSVSRTISYASVSKQKIVPVYEMEILHKIDLNGVCESLIYGQPLLVKPTMCWKLDVEELSQSQVYFQELCEQLSEDNCGLVVKRTSGDNISSFYLLIPSDNYFILKCLTPKELLLPRKEVRQNSRCISEDNSLRIKEFLDSLILKTDYNPVNYESGIYQSNLPLYKRNKRSFNSVPKNFENRKVLSFGFHETQKF